METNKPNLGYVFRGTVLKELYDPILPGFIPNAETGIVCYAGNKKFTPELHSAIFYSYSHSKAHSETPSIDNLPCVICVDAKYSSNYPETGSLDIMLTPASEIRLFPIDSFNKIKRLISEVKNNPTKDLIEIVDSYGGWESYEKIILEGCKEKLK